ncbi:AraC family transcriptional regulator [Planctomycetales bacterium 10988]|nr:AraC family transcriptional regulator [Planctomycetales bacterium 10988]
MKHSPVPRKRDRPVSVTLPKHGVFLLESHHAENFQMAPSRHDFLEILFVLQGKGTFYFGDRSYVCQAKEVVVVPPRQVHQIEDHPHEPMSLYGICLASSVYQVEPPALSPLLSSARPLPLSSVSVEWIRGELRQMLYEQTLDRPGSSLILLGQAQRFLGMLLRALGDEKATFTHPESPQGHEATVRDYLKGLETRFFEQHSLDQTVERLGISRRRFTQLMREITGNSWHAHLIELRIKHACHLLEQTNRSVTAIAFECGFEELSSFYRAFKRHRGRPPLLWRNARNAD